MRKLIMHVTGICIAIVAFALLIAAPAGASPTQRAAQTTPDLCGDEPEIAFGTPLPDESRHLEPGETLCSIARWYRGKGYVVAPGQPVTAYYLWSINSDVIVDPNQIDDEVLRLRPGLDPALAEAQRARQEAEEARRVAAAAQAEAQQARKDAAAAQAAAEQARQDAVKAQADAKTDPVQWTLLALAAVGLLAGGFVLLRGRERRLGGLVASAPAVRTAPQVPAPPAAPAAQTQPKLAPIAAVKQAPPSKLRLLAWMLFPGVLIGMFSGLGQLVTTVLDVLKQRYTPSALELGLASLATLAGILVTYVFISPRLDRFNRRRVALVLTIATAVLLVILPEAGGIWWLIMIAVGLGLVGAVEGPVRALIRIRSIVPKELRGRRDAYLNAWFAVGAAALTFGVPFLTDKLDFRAAAYVTAVAMFVMGILTYIVTPHDPTDDRGSSEQRRSFWRVLRTASVLRPGVYGGLNGVYYGILIASAALVLDANDAADWKPWIGVRYIVTAIVMALLLDRFVTRRLAPAIASWLGVASIGIGILALMSENQLFIGLWLGQFFLLEVAGMWLWTITMNRAPEGGVELLAVIALRIGSIAAGAGLGAYLTDKVGAGTSVGVALAIAIGLALISNRLLRQPDAPNKEVAQS